MASFEIDETTYNEIVYTFFEILRKLPKIETPVDFFKISAEIILKFLDEKESYEAKRDFLAGVILSISTTSALLQVPLNKLTTLFESETFWQELAKWKDELEKEKEKE